MKKVVDANCVNDKIVAAVQLRNASCFAALANSTDRTTNGWVTCMFEVGHPASVLPLVSLRCRSSSRFPCLPILQ